MTAAQVGVDEVAVATLRFVPRSVFAFVFVHGCWMRGVQKEVSNVYGGEGMLSYLSLMVYCEYRREAVWIWALTHHHAEAAR
jgi:hypothetical protein